MYRYAETPPRPKEQELAQAAVRLVTKRLNMLKPPEVVFIHADPAGSIEMPDPILACSDSLKVFFRTGLDARRLVECVAHEIFHVRHYFRHKRTPESGEREATLFAMEFMGGLDSRSHDDLAGELICKLYESKSSVAKMPRPQSETVQVVIDRLADALARKQQQGKRGNIEYAARLR